MWREAVPERPCMCFGSDVVVSCLRADAARLEMDACMCLCPRADAAYPQMDVDNGGLSEDREAFRGEVSREQKLVHRARQSWTLLHGNMLIKDPFQNVLCRLSDVRNQIRYILFS